ncbi:MAG: hypothetical protein CMO01_26130 [Thalassobius sp.]|nr:hypothetical protein [Thalassovita sp.]
MSIFNNLQSVFKQMQKQLFLLTLLSGIYFNTNAQDSLSYAYPLDPLDTVEIKLVKQILLEESLIEHDSSHLFSILNLNEPPKEEMLKYKPGDAFRREAYTVLYDFESNELSKIIVDLKSKKIISNESVKGKQPIGHFKADSVIADILAKDSAWIEALAKRDIPVDSVKASGNFAADLGLSVVGHREFIVSPRFKNKKYSKLPIGGLYAYVDVTDKKVLKVIDTGAGWSKPVAVNYFNGDSLKPIMAAAKPVQIIQPEGVNYEIKGQQVISRHWKFRYGIHNREGLVIYDLQFFDPFSKKWRMIMYRGSLAEMIVNYGSPDLLNASNNYFDAGEFRLFQKKARPLNGGADAPSNATYLPATVHDDFGNAVYFDSAVAVYDEYGGTMWRHENHARPATNLAIKYYITAGNYDYGFKWVFMEDGAIELVTELNGIAHIRPVERVSDMPGAAKGENEVYEGSRYGTLVEPHVEANNHQHFFVYRLDLDIDGAKNSVAEVNSEAVPAGPENKFLNTIIARMTKLSTEKDARRDCYAPSSRRWKFMNPEVRNKWGHVSSYMLMPSAGIKPMAHQGSSLSKRGGCLDYQFWVTPFKDEEIYPAGDYPVSNQEWEGLPKWTSQNRSIENTDVVAWYVAGITHIVRPEEWPMMNTHKITMNLMPFGFFSENPALGIAKYGEDTVLEGEIQGQIKEENPSKTGGEE